MTLSCLKSVPCPSSTHLLSYVHHFQRQPGNHVGTGRGYQTGSRVLATALLLTLEVADPDAPWLGMQ
jgi:hypothetical protein